VTVIAIDDDAKPTAAVKPQAHVDHEGRKKTRD
jgi:hypothetical protein